MNILAVNTNSYKGWQTSKGYVGTKLERALQGIANLGIKHVELSTIPKHCEHALPEKMMPEDLVHLKEMTNKYNLEVISISGHVEINTSMGAKLFKKRIQLARSLNVPIVNAGTGKIDSTQSKTNFFSNIKELAEYAKDMNIIIALETHGGPLTGTGKDSADTMEKINHPNVKINYDPANIIYYREMKPEEDIKYVLDYIVHVHLKDQKGGPGVPYFPPLGEGDVDFPAIFELLSKSEYSGPYSLEIELDYAHIPEKAEIVDEAINKSIRYLRDIKPDLLFNEDGKI